MEDKILRLTNCYANVKFCSRYKHYVETNINYTQIDKIIEIV